jgi:hypothetical protein
VNDPTSSTPESAFAWDAERRFPLYFAGFLTLSFLAHVATFFIFQVKYPARVTIPPPAAHITILSPENPEHQSLLAWVAAEDPALARATSRANPPGLSAIPYKPSYQALRTWPIRPPVTSEAVGIPTGPSGIEFVRLATQPAALPPPSPSITPTKLVLSGPLAARQMTGSFNPRVTSSVALSPSRFMLSVDARGDVRYAFLQDSSGEDKIDEAAARSVKALKFEASPDESTWGFVSIAWGDDVIVAPTPETKDPIER